MNYLTDLVGLGTSIVLIYDDEYLCDGCWFAVRVIIYVFNINLMGNSTTSSQLFITQRRMLSQSHVLHLHRSTSKV